MNSFSCFSHAFNPPEWWAQCFLLELVDDLVGCFHVELIKKENHTLLNGMKVRGLSSGHTMASGSDL